MRHRVAGRKLNITSSHCLALTRNMMKAMIEQFDKLGYVETTRAKAKFVQSRLEKMISLGREKSVHNVRRAMRDLQDRALVSKLFDTIGPFYRERPGGYTRIVRLERGRLGDNAPRVYFGFVKGEAALEEAGASAGAGDGNAGTADNKRAAK